MIAPRQFVSGDSAFERFPMHSILETRIQRVGRQVPRSGFTIIELMVSITIIGLLVAMLLPAVQSARETARRTTCINHLKQYGIAITGFETSHGEFPAGFGPYQASSQTGAGQSPIAQAIDWLGYPEFRVHLDPQNMYNGVFPYEPENWPAWTHLPLPTFLCPSDQGLPGTNYVACTGSKPRASATGFVQRAVGVRREAGQFPDILIARPREAMRRLPESSEVFGEPRRGHVRGLTLPGSLARVNPAKRP